MASRSATSPVALLLTLNILFFTLVSASSPVPAGGTCPYDTLKLKACANVLNLVNVVVGEEEKKECCGLIHGLVGLDAALCLCTRIRLSLLGLINLNIPLAVQLLINQCNVDAPKQFTCPSY